LILASASPRRIELLGRSGLAFEVIESGVAEIRRENESARAYAVRMAGEKAIAVSRGIADALVLAADTIVECGEQILEKPKSDEDARRMLNALSGRTHTVVTAFALARNGVLLESTPVLSRVTFRRLGGDEIGAYIASGEPLDKAGAYGIQGAGGDFIAGVEGPRDNVMGLPLSEVMAALDRHGFGRAQDNRRR
jgi:nucleoside triphosphate pyrophosphatase